jgi:hypothetical protein
MQNSENTINTKNEIAAPDPAEILASNDPGDDVLRRFRYQITYAGILCMTMIDSDDLEELFCEHHEDVLVRYSDQTYSGIQIKTKDLNLPPFNIYDESIFKSIKRFILLELQFTNKFRAFSIVSNHGFDRSKPAICVNTLIEKCKNAEKDDLLKARSKTRKFINSLCSETRCAEDFVISVISKIRLRSYSTLQDIHINLRNHLKNCKILKGVTESKIQEVGDLLILKCLNASSLLMSDESILFKYVTGEKKLEEVVKNCIREKAITKNDFNNWLIKQKELPVTLLLKDRDRLSDDTSGHRILEIKMDAGGIDSENITTLKDFKYAFEQHSVAWMYKDPDEAEKKYNHIMAVTQNLCKEIYDEENISDGEIKGQKMLIGVRKEIKERKKLEATTFLDCSYEHILGAVGVLTESCKVWWTPKFDIKE